VGYLSGSHEVGKLHQGVAVSLPARFANGFPFRIAEREFLGVGLTFFAADVQAFCPFARKERLAAVHALHGC